MLLYIYRDQGEEDKALCLKHVEMKGNYDTRSVSSCAACKYLKRKCTLNCIFAPYFPSDELGKFAKVHKVFGASNVSKILSEVPQDQRPDTVHTLVYEAEARLRDPVYGCIGAMALLHNKMLQLQQDLALVRSHLAHFTATNLPPPVPLPSTTIVYDDSIGTVPLVPYNICDGKRIENGSSCPVYCSEFDQYGSCSPPLGSFFQS